MNDKQTIGSKIKTLRKRKRWSQEHLVEVARAYIPAGRVLNRENISFYESGRSRPDTWVLAALAKALGVSMDYLMGESRPAMLTPEPELWTAVEEANRYPPHVRRVLAEIWHKALSLVNSPTGGVTETAGQDITPAASAEQSVAEELLGSLLDAADHAEDVRQATHTDGAGYDEAPLPNNGTAHHG